MLDQATLDARALRFDIEEFNAAYGAVLDAGRVEDWPAFFALAVAARRNILVSGPTGSGKTTRASQLPCGSCCQFRK